MKTWMVVAGLVAALSVVAGVYVMSNSASAQSTPPGRSEWGSAQAKFLAENGKKSGWKTTPSGLQYKKLADGKKDGPKPAPGSEVTVHYEGKLIDGQVFDSSYARNEPATFPLDGVIPGWTEGVPLMREGETFEFAIPAALAYGQRAVATIPPGSALIFKVELLKVMTPAK
jgi:FKBP-type peptidyl-prolyl cis-trans isomerase FkpA